MADSDNAACRHPIIYRNQPFLNSFAAKAVTYIFGPSCGSYVIFGYADHCNPHVKVNDHKKERKKGLNAPLKESQTVDSDRWLSIARNLYPDQQN